MKHLVVICLNTVLSSYINSEDYLKRVSRVIFNLCDDALYHVIER